MMRLTLVYLVAVFALLVTPKVALGASSKPSSAHAGGKHPVGLAGGWATHAIRSPTQNFTINPGPYISATYDRSLGFLGLYIVLTISYTTSIGNANYDYTNKIGENYTARNLSFKSAQTQLSPGLRMKLFDQSFFRPYVEAGGIVGSYELEFNNATSIVGPSSSPNRDIMTKETNADLGSYAEAGIEFWFGSQFALRGAGRIVRAQANDFQMIKKQSIAYDSEVYMFSIHKVF